MESKKTAELLKSIWENLTDEQKEKAKACKTADELIKLAGEEGIELPDEALEAVSGGYLQAHYSKGRIVGYHVLSDSDGAYLDYGYSEKEAKMIAKKLNVSDKVISTEMAQELRGEKGC